MDSSASPRSPASDVATDYRPLQKYLHDRFADTVVLTFGQIEDLIGHPLPALAYSEPSWWVSATGGAALSPQCRAWTQASRTALANLGARSVVFDRA